MQCPQCSATISERATVCPSCRYVLPTPAAISISIAQQQRQELVNMPLQWPFRKLMLGLGVVLIGFAIYACVALLLGARVTDASMIISLIFGLTCLIALPVVAVINFLLLGTMRHIAAGNYLVHWTYTKSEWDRFTEDAWQRSSKLNAWVVGALALILCIWALASGSSAIFLMLVIVVASVALLLFGSDYWLYTQRCKQGAGEVLIGRAGILRPEGFTPLSGLDSVTLEQGIIKFRCRYRAYQNRYYQTRYRTYEVPVPRGHEAEAEGLVGLLRRS